MTKDKNRGEFVRNTSGKNIQFTNPKTNKLVFVKRGARVQRKLVMFTDENGNERMWGGFTLEARAPREKRPAREIADEQPTTTSMPLYEMVSEDEEDNTTATGDVVTVDDEEFVEPESLPVTGALKRTISEAGAERKCRKCGGPVSKGSKTGICRDCWRKGMRPGDVE